MNSIHIGKPEIKFVPSEIFGTAIRMAAPVKWRNPKTGIEEIKECYFDIDKELGGGI